jgi:hypothetical protein
MVLDIPVLERDLGHRLPEQSHPPLLVVLAMVEDKELQCCRIEEGQEVDQGRTLLGVVVT